MGDGQGPGGSHHAGAAPFWALIVIVAVGLVVMIVTPLTGR